MTKHSPAPWTCHPNFSTSHIYHVYDGNECFFAADNIDCETQKANARLIAAAPELLEALEYLVDNAAGSGEYFYLRLNKARAAIAKANGV